MSADLSKATPRPWRVGGEDDWDGIEITAASRKGMLEIVFVSVDNVFEAEQRANAALIVKAVNERDELIEVLRDATDKLCHYATNYPEPDALAIINRSDRLIARGQYSRDPDETLSGSQHIEGIDP